MQICNYFKSSNHLSINFEIKYLNKSNKNLNMFNCCGLIKFKVSGQCFRIPKGHYTLQEEDLYFQHILRTFTLSTLLS